MAILGECIRLSETHEMALELMILGMIIFFPSDFYTGEMEKTVDYFCFLADFGGYNPDTDDPDVWYPGVIWR